MGSMKLTIELLDKDKAKVLSDIVYWVGGFPSICNVLGS